MKVNLINIQNEITKQVDTYLQKYYKKDSIAPYLTNFVLDYLNNCRYSQSKHDDVRPLLTKLGYEMTGEKYNEYILPAMSAIHLVLLSSIPLDDVVDGLERQKNYTIQDLPHIIAKAYSISSKLREDARVIMGRNYRGLLTYGKIEEIISYCVESQDGSHTAEVNIHGKKLISKYSLSNYFEIIDQSTSTLLAESFVIGGLIAGIDEKTEKTMRNFGMELGRLAQIRDDYIDYVDPKLTGKFPFADLHSRRKRFPLLIAYKIGNKSDKQKIGEILNKKIISQEDIIEVMGMITSEKVERKTGEIIDEIYNRTILDLKQLPQKQPTYQSLKEITNLFAMK